MLTELDETMEMPMPCPTSLTYPHQWLTQLMMMLNALSNAAFTSQCVISSLLTFQPESIPRPLPVSDFAQEH